VTVVDGAADRREHGMNLDARVAQRQQGFFVVSV
jgi:hypothetical protein